jgi:hypothetical protein
MSKQLDQSAFSSDKPDRDSGSTQKKVLFFFYNMFL